MKKIKRSTLIPLVLAVYLCVMAYIGYEGYATGQTSAMQYFGVIGVTVVILILLHFNLKKRERLRQKRMDDMKNNSNDKTN